MVHIELFAEIAGVSFISRNRHVGLKVKGMSGGISTFTAPKPEANWWWIKAGTPVPSKLVITRDTTDPRTGITHYTIRPESDMFLTEFVAQLQSLLHVERLPIERAIELGGRWEKR